MWEIHNSQPALSKLKPTFREMWDSTNLNPSTSKLEQIPYQGRVPHVPPNFLRSLMDSTNHMRLSLQKAAHATSDGPAYRKFGSPQRTWAEKDGAKPLQRFRSIHHKPTLPHVECAFEQALQ
jgi:hypothetical protein